MCARGLGNAPSYQMILVKELLVPEVLEVHVLASEEVRIGHGLPLTTVTIKLFPYAIPYRAPEIPELCEVHVVPLDDV